MSILLALWSFATSPFGRIVSVGLLCLSFGFFQGFSLKAKFDRSATLSAIVDKQSIDLQAAKDAAQAANATIAIIAARDAQNQEIISGFKGNSCVLDDAAARELRRLK